MTPPISNPESLAHVQRLLKAYEGSRALTATRRDARSEVQDRLRAVRAQLVQHDADRPAPNPDVSEELSSVLAANPSAAASADWEGRLREAQVAHDREIDGWQGKRTVLLQAIEKLEREIDGAEQAEQKAQENTDAHWKAFVVASYCAMIDEFEAHIEEFYSSALCHLEALHAAQGKCGVSLSEGGWFISPDTRIGLRRVGGGRLGPEDRMFFPRRDAIPDASLSTFREAMPMCQRSQSGGNHERCHLSQRGDRARSGIVAYRRHR